MGVSPSRMVSHRVYTSANTGNGHAADQNRTGADVRARVDIPAHRLDRTEHVAQVARNGDAIDRMQDLAALDAEARGAARIVAGDGVDALPHQAGHQQAVAHVARE